VFLSTGSPIRPNVNQAIQTQQATPLGYHGNNQVDTNQQTREAWRMDEPEKKAPGKRRRVPWWGLAGILIVYLASLGPALFVAAVCDGNRLFGSSGTPAVDAIDVVYRPLTWICERSPTLTALMDGYVEWWLGLVP
jgi:hypothetical protein